MAKQVQLHDNVNKKLDELAATRRKEGNLVHTKQNIVAELIEKAHKREIKE